MNMRRRRIIELALQRKTVERIPCFPLIDLVFAAGQINRSVRELELDPALHTEALCACADRFPVDGVYLNICLSREQAERMDYAAGTCRIDGALDINMPADDATSIARTDILSLDDTRGVGGGLSPGHAGDLSTHSSAGPGPALELSVNVNISPISSCDASVQSHSSNSADVG